MIHHPELPIVSIAAAILLLLPLPWHWRTRNLAVLSVIFWLCAVNVINFVNAIVWAGNVRVVIPVWCDIVTKITVGSTLAVPAATLCICKHLELIASSRTVRTDPDAKRQRMLFETFMCFGIPIIFMALHIVVQDHRFMIFEDIGCQPSIFNSVPSVVILILSALILSIIALAYGVANLIHLYNRRKTFSKHLRSTYSSLNTNVYLRLMIMALTQIHFNTPINIFKLVSSLSKGLHPYTSWNTVHAHLSEIVTLSTSDTPDDLRGRAFVLWWTTPAASLIFFVFFGFGSEVTKEYRQGVKWVRKNVFHQSIQPNSAASQSGNPLLLKNHTRPTPSSPERVSKTLSSSMASDTFAQVHPTSPLAYGFRSPSTAGFSDGDRSSDSPFNSYQTFDSVVESERGADVRENREFRRGPIVMPHERHQSLSFDYDYDVHNRV